MPAMPSTEAIRPRPSVAVVSKRRTSSRSSLWRPTKAPVCPAARPLASAGTGAALKAGTGSAFPFSCNGPTAAKAMADSGPAA